MSALGKFNHLLVNTLFKRNSVFLTGIFAGAFAFEVGYDGLTDRIWRRLNEGRTWDDIKDRYTS
ncbi:cytochrome b-c1 complex subunit 9 [Syncephalis pseudoplumigaleata]|uniref:Complex III subunit 9 n=1 Tax=Syncephalis pseudoplumigaleata TaxID=1712513 RepID=A0A4P9Z621_9FUNG|nr:cytochrome b-c1 complex subunit 9 [Syncephalis pseudoplumigaleata]|eukprot:RKP28103.1 cytochrome b-c1 complex subunit 9 [Syncephalis pseudoplumigaleata]